MKKSTQVNIYKIASALSLGGLAALYYIYSRWNDALTQAEAMCILCDAFSLPGMFMTLIAMLCSINYSGGLDTVAYLLSWLPRMIAPGVMGEPKHLIDFVEERRAKRKKGYGFLYVVGFIFLGISLVFLVLFYRAS